MRKINIFDTTLRDGEQSAGINLNHSEKMEVARQLERLGVDIIEAGFPASSKGDFRAVKEIADTIRNCSVTGLSRSNMKDIDISWEALKDGAEPRLHLFIATSPIHMQYKLKMTPEQVLQTAVDSVKYAAQKFPIIQFSAEDATRSDLPFLAQVVKAVIDAGATVINIPDTVGYTTPKEYGQIFTYLKENVPNIGKAILSTHCHDDLGMAVANSLSAVEHGAGQVECTINGIGERAGNAALEEIGVALHIRNDFYQAKTGLNLQQIKKTSTLVSKLTGVIVPPNKAVIGKNAFAHESGIHQDGILKEKSTYEIISPELVGVASNDMVLGKHSGRHAFRNRMEELGYTLTTEEINNLFVAFKELADKKKEITDDDLLSLLFEEKLGSSVKFYSLKSLQVQYVTHQVTTATISMTTPENEEVHEACTGSGSVEAIYNTLERIIGSKVHLEDYRIQANTGGRDALAEVFVKINFQGMTSSGRGSAQDVLEASAKAYINAVNRILLQQQYREELQNLVK
ncbi:2-isopropylmalate synthase [Schinkia azotoformans]|uniref:2-isopropylmalate synthase n=1 Tax=Schinkia azotoformans LMG 9581 TaxID=1131731 RepID=K6CHH1_SCHAZ|nr:2-isopropylmalate synthase [Schinkia azotoformans]EKN70570.1 2-isopropylmalate synthase [Schinkia azotoformans LMG 9581]MEC1637800.1 2-isopropylmalate synthase [Schinkia azotoformans]MEC1720401.1 2-isopropylmalate synthase [Schinkia azotoformans]MEC1945035.1 2-isopropylmalate synthase [Schinkia azotoformans]MED4351662.1 2-isopropylmalate synthase [Schinkia azotoformans]